MKKVSSEKKDEGNDDGIGTHVLISCLACICFVLVLMVCYLSLGAYVAACWTALLALLWGFATLWLYCTGRIPPARTVSCVGLAVAGLGVHWSFGGSDRGNGVVNWAVLGPQLAIITGYVGGHAPYLSQRDRCTCACHGSM